VNKLAAILGACVVVAAGGAYAFHTYSESSCESHTCPLARAIHGPCCHEPITTTTDDATPTSALAVAGPVALFATVPVKAEVSACCLTKKASAVHACCEDDAPTTGGLEAVAGSAATLARK